MAKQTTDLSTIFPNLKGVQIDWTTVQNTIAAEIINGVTTLVQGAAEDIQNFAGQIAADTIEIMQIPDADRRGKLLEENMGQLQVLGEKNRLRAVNVGWNTVAGVVRVVTSIGNVILSGIRVGTPVGAAAFTAAAAVAPRQ